VINPHQELSAKRHGVLGKWLELAGEIMASVQLDHQGALLCQDWPGPQAVQEPVSQEHYFAAEDLNEENSVEGLIAFHFACFGAGTPRLDEFAHAAGRRQDLAPRSFVARLPQRLLSHRAGSALAVVGHVERAWSFSFQWPGAGGQLAVFESAFRRLMQAHPIGSAMEVFNQRYAELSCELSAELEELQFGKKVDEKKISTLWAANNDARNYMVFGDPAVRAATGVET
jgi:hypothetical protein